MKLSSRVYVSAIAVATGLYFFTPAPYQTHLYEAIAVSAALAMLWGTLRNKPERPEAWLLIAAGVFMFAAGDIVFGDGQAVPSPADMLYLSGYPLIALGLSGLSPWRPSRRYSNVVIAGIVTTVVAVVCWFFLIVPNQHGDSAFVSQFVTLSYVGMDAVLIMLLIRAERNGAAEGVSKLLGVGLTLLLVADVLYATDNFGNSYSAGHLVDAAWLLSYAFLGAALLDVRSPWAGVVFDAVRPGIPSSGGGTAVLEKVATVQLPRLRAHDIQFGVVISTVGRMLFGLGLAVMIFGVKWLAPSVILLGGAYLFVGVATWMIGSRAVRD